MPGKSTVSQRGRPKSIVSQAGEVVREVFDTITGTEGPRRRVRRSGVRKAAARKASATKRSQPAVKRAKAIVSNIKSAGKKRGPKARSRTASTAARVHH
ncbi:MAG TPA: hypothetical protein VIG33_16240 [Pseudobdellovibrionaceae bacterium]